MYYQIEKGLDNSDSKGSGWSESDLLVLVTEYWKRRDTMRPKAPETVTNMERRQCWLEITETVNSRCFNDSGIKTMDQIKRKWERTVMLAKKAAQNIQRKNGNLSDLTPTYQLALSIVCDDLHLPMDLANACIVEASCSTSYAESSTSLCASNGQGRYFPELEEDSCLETPVETVVGAQAVGPSYDSDEGTEQKRQKREEGWRGGSQTGLTDLLELRMERVRNQMRYEQAQHQLHMDVLKAQLQFWERKSAFMSAESQDDGT